MKVHLFIMKLDREEWLRYYRGHANTILVTSLQGTKISISAHHFREYTTIIGVHGFFRLILDRNNKFLQLEKLG